MEDDAVLKVEQPKMSRPLPSRGFYFGLLALAVMGLWTLGGTFSLFTIFFSLLIVYAAGVLRILREHNKALDNLNTNRDRLNSGELFKLSTKITRYLVLFMLPLAILIILFIGFAILVFSYANFK